MRLMRFLILTGLLTLTGLATARAENWTVYANPRFGTFADYPSERFHALRPPENGDGQSFQARDGATLAIFGGYNVENASPAAYEASLRADDESGYAHVTYRANGDDWLVLSGIRGDNIFYEKYLFKGDVIHGMVLTYPQSLKRDYDAIAARVARSLGAGKVEMQ